MAFLDIPKTKYVSVGGMDVAYQVLGDAPIDLVLLNGGAAHVDAEWDDPIFARAARRLAGFARLIRLDRRGAGASDPLPSDASLTWEDWVEDLVAVLDAVGSERAAILAELDAGPIAMLFAATRPERVSSLLLGNSSARILAADDYPEGVSEEVVDAILELVRTSWGTEEMMRIAIPSIAHDDDLVRIGARFNRASLTPRAAFAQYNYILRKLDVRDVLPLIRTPTLVMHTTNMPIVPIEQGRYIADHIAAAKFVEIPGADATLFGARCDAVIDEVAQFITGRRDNGDAERALSTLLFTDIVDSTQRANELRDSAWRRLLDRHDQLVRRHLDHYGGRLVKSTGDGALATFDGPARAVRCALALRDSLREIGVCIRAGLHVGEVERRGADLGGIAVHIAARIESLASAEEVLVSRTVKDLMAGSTFSFTSRGVHVLKGLPDSWEVFAVAQVE